MIPAAGQGSHQLLRPTNPIDGKKQSNAMRANWRRSAYSAVLLVSLFSLVVIADEQIRVSNAIVDGNRLVVAFLF